MLRHASGHVQEHVRAKAKAPVSHWWAGRTAATTVSSHFPAHHTPHTPNGKWYPLRTAEVRNGARPVTGTRLLRLALAPLEARPKQHSSHDGCATLATAYLACFIIFFGTGTPYPHSAAIGD
jgi:hypothetical protein